MSDTKSNEGFNISVKSFITAIVVIFILMLLTYALTFIIPGGEYQRVENANGDLIIDTSSSFEYVEGGLPFWKWLLSPVLVLGASGGGMLIAVIAFLLVIGGVFNSLESHGLMKYMLDRIVYRFGKARYKLMAILLLFFMAMGSFIGSFEECVPLVPIVVALSISLGWDTVTGMGMSILAAGCGFAAGVCNPFTIGVAQGLVGLPMFSGAWLRAVNFVLIYALLLVFVRYHAKKVERPIELGCMTDTFERDRRMDKGLVCFASILGVGILIVFSSSLISALQDYTMVIVAVMFLAAGICATLVSGMKLSQLGRSFVKGVVSILPAVIMILMAASIKYTLEEAHILDTILNAAVVQAATMPKWAVILFIYMLVLVLNFFIASGSAKAFLLMPLIVPIAEVFGIPAQLCIMAYAFGDGFSNVFYPTNAALLISLGLANVSYGEWVKWSWKFQAANLLLTSCMLLVGLSIGYA